MKISVPCVINKNRRITPLIIFLILACTTTYALAMTVESHMTKRATESMREKIAYVLNNLKTRSMKPNTIIDDILTTADKIDSLAQCVTNDIGCSGAQRSALMTTAITLFTLTTQAVGRPTTVVTASHEIDKHVSKTSQAARGLNSREIIVQLNTSLTAFKQHVITLRPCLLKHTCAKEQMLGLYNTAATITALAIVSVGLPVEVTSLTRK